MKGARLRMKAMGKSEMQFNQSRELVFTLADNARVTVQYFPSCTEAQLVLSDAAHHACDESAALAEHISADGVAQVFRPLRRVPDEGHDSKTMAVELMQRLLELDPAAPLVLGTLCRHEGLQMSFPRGYFGSAGALPRRTFCQARDGTPLALRYYHAASDLIVILLHGATTHDSLYAPLARFMSARNLAQIYAPTLRGHGASGGRRGDVDYIGQLEDDIADLISYVRAGSPRARIILLGHSMGGGLALRFAASRYASQVDGYILLAPYLGVLAPTQMSLRQPGWARSHLGNGVVLTFANALAISRWNDRRLVDFDIPKVLASDFDTRWYSYRMWSSAAPHLNYRSDLRALVKPTLLLVGTQDQMFAPAVYAKVNSYARTVALRFVPNATHLGIVYSPRTHQHISSWLMRLSKE